MLGAGIMGCCLALELARRGRRVDLFDLAATPMTGASLHNEGKLHLGFVYANDPQKKTHPVLLRGSLAFSRILLELTGQAPSSCRPSQPFHYFVPVDSQLGLAALGDHFEAVEQTIREATLLSGERYLGQSHERYHECNSPRRHAELFSPDRTLGSFGTQERAVSPQAVASILRRAVCGTSRIAFIGNTRVVTAARHPGGFVEIETSRDDGSSIRRYPAAANCLWDDKVRVDRSAGITADGPWILRYKATIRFEAPAAARNHIPSATGILGKYGDVVNHEDGSCYVSWYPLCKLAHTLREDGRQLHDSVHRGTLTRCVRMVVGRSPALASGVAALAHRHFVRQNVGEMAAYVPAMAGLLSGAEKGELGGGVILARGATDIDDPGSELHQRSVIGPTAHDAYVTVNTGKYCMGPLFALETADLITDILH